MRGRAEVSCSGLKTAVKRHVASRKALLRTEELPSEEIADLCASFQRVVVETLLDRTFEVARWFDARSVGIAGGVSANTRLRVDAIVRGEHLRLPVLLPSLALSTDNAAMIGAAGIRNLRADIKGTSRLNAFSSLDIF